MFTIRSLRILLVALFAHAFIGNAVGAGRLTASDARAIETTIRSQIDAFGHDDAVRAFGYATRDIQRMFGSPDNFLRMVRDAYRPVYRPGSIAFIRIEPVGSDWVQTVQLSDDEGRVWRALFSMKRQRDRSWKIAGCRLVQTGALAT